MDEAVVGFSNSPLSSGGCHPPDVLEHSVRGVTTLQYAGTVYLRIAMLEHPDKMKSIEKKGAATGVIKLVPTSYQILNRFARDVVDSGRMKDIKEVIIPSTICVLLDDEDVTQHI